MATGNPVIATAALGLVPVIQGVQGNIASQLAGSQVMSGADRAGRSIGSRLGSTITSGVKTTLKIGGIITGAVGAMTLKGGLNRALGIEDARAMMSGLGHDTESVEKIMGNALASVEGTAFGLDAAATSAAGAVAAGIKPGEQLEKTLTTVANVAAGAKAPMDEIGSIFNTVAAVGTAYTGDINMIAQRGIPIWQSLGSQLGKTQDEVKKMATKGEIDFATFEAAAADAAGGVAVAMGDTTRGSIANMLTSFSKLGADVVTRFMPMVKAGASGIQATVQAVTAKLGPVLDHLFGAFTPAATAGVEGFFENLVAWIEGIDPQRIIDVLDRVGEIGRTVFAELKGGVTAFGAAWAYNDGEVTSSGFPGVMERAGYFVRQLWDSVKELDFSSFSAFTDSISGSLSNVSGTGALAGVGGALSDIAAASPTLLAAALEGVGNAMGFLAEHSDTIVKLLPWLIAGFAAYRVASQGVTTAVTAQRAAYIASLPLRIAANTALAIANGLELANTLITNRNTAATNLNAAATTRSTIAQRAHNVATRLGTIATTIAAGAQRAFGAALRFAMGPIGWIITGVTLLVGALVLFFTKTEVGQKLWSKIWGWMKDAAAAVVDWFTGTALPYLQAAWDGIAAGALWLYQNAIVPAWNGIKTAIAVVGDWITGTLWPAMQAAWNGIAAAALWLWQSVIQPVWTGIKVAIAIAVTAVLVYIDLLKWYFSNVIAPVALWLWRNVITPAWNGIKVAIGAVVGWIVNTAWPLIKQAWDAIAAAAMWLWNSVLKPAWAGIQAAISAVVNWLTGTAWPFIKQVWDAIAAGATWLWQNVITPVWAGIRAAIAAVVSWLQNTAWPLINTVIGWLRLSFEGWKIIAQTVWSAIRTAISTVANWFRDTAWPIVSNVIDSLKSGFNVMRDSVKNAWSFIQDKVINPVANWFRDTIKPLFDRVTGGIKDAFNLLKESVEKAWNGIRDTAKTPVKFLVETIIRDGIIKKYNEVANGVFGLPKVDDSKFTVGWATGGYTGPGSKYQPAGIVHADEYVIRKESQNDLRRKAPGFLDSLNQFGAKALGYAGGGRVKLRSPFDGSYPRGDGFGARGGRHKGIDWAMPSGTILRAVAAGTASRSWNPAAGKKLELAIGNGLVAGYHHLSGYIAKGGQQVGAGAGVGYVGSTGRSSGPHLHFSLRKDGTYVDPAPYLGAGGAAGTGGGGSWWNPFDGLWESLKGKVRDGVGDSAFGDTLFEVPKKVIGGAVDWATAQLAAVGDFGTEVVSSAGSRARWAPVMANALRMKGQWGINRQRWGLDRLMQESSGDPNAVNTWDSNARRGTPSKGLMQVIGPTFRAYAEPGYSSNILDPLSNILASINYTLATYGSLEKGWTRRGGYANGGWTGAGSKFDPAGIVHADEYVIRRESQRSISRAAPGLLDSLNARGAGALGLGGYASGGLVSPNSKIGSTRVSVIVDGLVGTTKQVKTAAGKLADAITAEFKKKLQGNKSSTIATLSDQLDGLKDRASALQKTARATSKFVETIGKSKNGKPITRTVTVSTAAAKRAAEQLKSVQKQITSTEATLKKVRRGDMTAAAASASAAFFERHASSNTDRLATLAQSREKLTAQIKDANAALADAVKTRDEYAGSLTGKFADTYSLTDTAATTGVETILRRFQDASSATKAFSKQLAELRSKGLGSGLVDQIAQLGVTSGSKVATNLLTNGTTSQIQQITTAYTSLNTAASKSGTAIAQDMYSAGVQSAQGLVRGLQSQKSAVDKAAQNISESMVTTVRKALGIKSPSRVMAEVGRYTGQGMVLGIQEMTPAVRASLRDLVDTSAVDDLRVLAESVPARPASTAPRYAPVAAAVRGDSAPGYQFGDVYGHSAEEVAEQIEKKRRRREALYA